MIVEYSAHDTLNPVLWDGDVLKRGLREKFLNVIKYYVPFLDLPENIKVDDVVLVGSNANYNWTENSDVDLHVVFDYAQLKSESSLVFKYMIMKKNVWGQKYPLKIGGMPLELFAQNSEDELASSGVYSVLHNKWIKKPEYENIIIDDSLINIKAEAVKSELNQVDPDDPDFTERVESIVTRLYALRKSGLEDGGEYSIENLAFKQLRSDGVINKVKEMVDAAKMKKMDIKTQEASGL